MDEINNCICGGIAKLWTSPVGDFVRCEKCGLTVAYHGEHIESKFDDNKIIGKWNLLSSSELRKYRAAYEALAEYATKSLLNVKEGGTTLSHSLKDELMARFLEAKENG